jgi:phosphatidylethanolamine/phosphatidyl-N-methylethanolamine N-methyltransferase
MRPADHNESTVESAALPISVRDRATDRERVSDRVYRRLAPYYDVLYGIGLEPGRARALERLALHCGESVLEIGVGTGLSAVRYPPTCRVVAIDVSLPMLARAKARLLTQDLHHVALCRMDAGHLAFSDEAFDAVYAPYLINVVPNPTQVAREMLRVCRRGGRLVFLNHFRLNGRAGLLDRCVGRLAAAMTGVNWDLDLTAFLQGAGLVAASVEPVNLPPVSSVVLCRKP